MVEAVLVLSTYTPMCPAVPLLAAVYWNASATPGVLLSAVLSTRLSPTSNVDVDGAAVGAGNVVAVGPGVGVKVGRGVDVAVATAGEAPGATVPPAPTRMRSMLAMLTPPSMLSLLLSTIVLV